MTVERQTRMSYRRGKNYIRITISRDGLYVLF